MDKQIWHKPSLRIRRLHRSHRRGAIVVLAAILMIPMVIVVACGLDLGYVCLVQGELQRSADASALAGAGALYLPHHSTELTEYVDPTDTYIARTEAQRFAGLNGSGPYRKAGSPQFHADLNLENTADGDIVLGFFDVSQNEFTPSETDPNAMRTQLRFDPDHLNGALTLFFARVFGADTVDLRASATATIVDYPVLLPITAPVALWESTEVETDEYSVEDGVIVDRPDGVRELTIYPGDWDGSDLPPGNFGILSIGPDSGSSVFRRQIDGGPSSSDFDYHGGSLFEGMQLPGMTGLKAGAEIAFLGGNADGTTYPGMLGKSRYLPLYADVTGNGRNAMFTIAKFVSVHVVAVDLRSNPKSVVVQAAPEDSLRYTTALVQ